MSVSDISFGSMENTFPHLRYSPPHLKAGMSLLTPWQPRTYLIIFVTCDIFNLILQGLGGGISSTQQHPKGIQAGINIVIAGLVSQVVSLSIFMICCAHFVFRVLRSVEKPVERFSHVRDTKRFQSFLIGELFFLISLTPLASDVGSDL
jgi:hypothetical protein